ncbi:unnamed protein product [Gongylonema pulchrum]|uniref:Uncharacterized protein n=1 Tax=Gongylonema pulchrum TaxID=637853 RepID=A0A3P6RHQ2_9BILA|nr:unnamed protein product [Gongylonema pulchrum]
MNTIGGGSSGTPTISERDSPVSTTSSTCSNRASLAAEMFAETGDFGITLAEQLQLTK